MSHAKWGVWSWIVLAMPPLFFFITIVVASVWVVGTGVTDSNEVAGLVANATPWMLLIVQVLMLGLLALVWRAERSARPGPEWTLQAGQTLRSEIFFGAAIGVALAVLYGTVLEPALVWLQQTFGDYVPAGELWPSLGSALLPFFVANVVLAPLVEESLYRGFALPRLIARFGKPAALVIHAIAFGTLHWSGGFWYMLLTGLIAGGLFAWLTLSRRQIITSYAAHLALNLVEFGFVTWAVWPR